MSQACAWHDCGTSRSERGSNIVRRSTQSTQDLVGTNRRRHERQSSTAVGREGTQEAPHEQGLRVVEEERPGRRAAGGSQGGERLRRPGVLWANGWVAASRQRTVRGRHIRFAEHLGLGGIRAESRVGTPARSGRHASRSGQPRLAKAKRSRGPDGFTAEGVHPIRRPSRRGIPTRCTDKP